MSLPEVLFWQRLRGAPSGIRFRRQHPIGPYVADFYCPAARLVIEVDGEVHSTSKQQACDAARDAEITHHGFSVIRIAAAEVLRDPDAVANDLIACAATPLHRASHGPPPRAGEDRRPSEPEDYEIDITPLSIEDGRGFATLAPELPGCRSDGETPEEALRNGYDAVACWIEAAREQGRSLPELRRRAA